MSEPQQHQPDPADVEGFDPEVGDDEKSSRRINLNTVQIGAGAAASVTSALAASFFGVAGTLIGAAVGSIVSTVAAAVYADSMRRAADRVRVTQAIVVQKVAATGAVPTLITKDEPQTVAIVRQASPPTVVNPAVVNPTVINPAVTVPVEHATPVERATPVELAGPRTAWWRRRWVSMTAMMLAGFAIALGVITAIEFVGGGTVSGEKGTSSVGRVFGQTASTGDDTPTEQPTSTPSVSPSATSSVESSQAPVAPSASATTAPTASATTEPSASATTAPSASASVGTDQLQPGSVATTDSPAP